MTSPHHTRSRRRGALLLGVVLLLQACAGGGETLDRNAIEIRSAIEAHLRQRGLNPATMEMEISDLVVEADQARILATFRAADSDAEFRFAYQLRRQGEGWQVISSEAREGHGEGNAPPLPEGHPPLPPAEPSEDSS